MTTKDALEIREQFVTDIHRPNYHYLPPANWMNDPNGIIQFEGQYHLFYQNNPYAPIHTNMHWGHAVSSDLIHWQDLPVAIAPTPDSPDEGGIWSGCIVNNNGVPTAFYTGVSKDYSIQRQCMATSTDNLLTWQKYANNPVIGTVPPEMKQTRDFRDPFVWHEADAWYMVIASAIKGALGAVLLYRSQDLINWEYLHPLLVGEDIKHGTIWECPNFFKLGDKWVLLISAHTGSTVDTVYYFVGDYENYRFTPLYSDVLDYGVAYASLTLLDEQERRLMISWLREGRHESQQRHAGWSGVQSIPRVLTLDSQNHLLTNPVPELERIRGKHHHFADVALTQKLPLNVNGLSLDMVAEFELAPDGHCVLSVACSPDNSERTDIIYDAATLRLSVRRVFPELNSAVTTHIREISHELAPGENLQLHILLDGSVLEIIANQHTSLTSRLYPVQRDSQQVELSGSNARLHALDIWEMPSIWQ